MTEGATLDHKTVISENLADFRSLLDAIDETEWDADSLCEGWRVRDVVGHILAGTTVSVPRVMLSVAASGFRVDKVVAKKSREMGSAQTVDELRTMFEQETTRAKLRGVAGLQPAKVLAADSATHLLDISVPLDRPSGLTPERKAAVLDLLLQINGWGTKKRAKGLHLSATDIGWNGGEGADVSGSAEALILTLGGRRAKADELSGDGAQLLRSRLPDAA